VLPITSLRGVAYSSRVTPIRVVYRKYDGSLHWHQELGQLGADEHGTWLAAPAGSQSRRGSEEPVTFPHAYVLLIPRSGGWTMTCNAEPCWTELYIDITTVPRWLSDDQVEMVDLDLDVIRRFDGSAEILDEDEFAEHQVRYGYPPEVISDAERTASAMLAAVTSGAEPFGRVCRAWLARVPAA
jgi:uncharacterized protein